MTTSLFLVLLLLIAVVVMFVLDRPRMDAVALLAICLLPLTGVISMTETLAGFSDPNIILIAAMFVVGEGLVRTGVARGVGDWVITRAGNNPAKLIVLLMTAVCGLGATMSSTAVTAIFIPVVMRICQKTGTAPGQLMMPVSMAALISGMMTLIATAPNLVVQSELVRRGSAGFQFFSFSPFGLPILALSIIYMLAIRNWLPSHSQAATSSPFHRPNLSDWVTTYHLADREYRLRVMAGSPLAGERLEALALRGTAGANLIAIHREGVLLQPTGNTVLLMGDVLFVDLFGQRSDIEALCQEYQLDPLPLSGAHFTDLSQDIGMAEMFVPADSELIGKTIVSATIRTRFGFSVIGLRRGRQQLAAQLTTEELQVGDTLLVIGPWRSIRQMQTPGTRDLIPLNLPAELFEMLPAPGKATPALVILLLVAGLMVSGVVPNVQAALVGCLLMGACGCITFESAYRSIDWKTLILIVGMLPFSVALERTGGVALAADALVSITSNMGAYGVMAVLFATTAGLGLFISNTATAVLMTPVALSIADELQASPYPFAMIVALAASTAFMTPVSSPVNTLVVTPGGYHFSDFVRIGVPFSLIVMLVCVVMVPWLLPL